MPLRKADLTNTRRFEDGSDWMILRTGGLTKGEADRLRDISAAFRMDPTSAAAGNPVAVEVSQRVAEANRALFELLCVEWSVGDVSGEAYSELDEESGGWVDECIAEVLRERRERAEKKGRSSRKPARPARSSRAAGA